MRGDWTPSCMDESIGICLVDTYLQRADVFAGARVEVDHAFNYGLNNAQLRLVLDVITKQSELDQTSITSLIKNLYPGQKVQNEAVTIVVGCLGQAQGKPSPTTQASLIKWLITVYEFIEDPTIISRLYTVLFGLLDMISLRFEGKVACAFARTRIKAIKQSADLLETIIKPVEAKLLAGHSITFTRMLHFYTDLARHLQLLVAAADDDAVQVIEHRIECFEQLAHHVLNLLPPILTTPQCSQSTTTAVIEFLEILATSLQYFHEISPSVFQQMPIILPQPHTIYILLFDTSVSDISHLCSILATYKGVLQKRRLTSTSLQQQTIDQFNGYLMDVCNLLWRSRAFGRGDINAMGCFLPESALPVFQDYLWNIDHEYGLPYIFGLSHHASLSLLSITALRELEDLAETRGEDLRLKHAGPVTQRSLMKLDKDGGFKITWRDYRVQVLDYLEKRSLGGIKELMFSTMKDLTPNAI
ncbi:MAG: hypothetical protein Q9157_004149 [Trypethelium eluteriae]